MRADLRRSVAVRCWRVLSVVLLLALTAACATIPTAGPVRQGRVLDQGPPEGGPKIVAQSPADGASPEAIVSGFVQSGADFRDEHAFAREYLTGAARGEWDPGTRTTIYDKGADVFYERQADGSIVMTATEVAHIDEDGRYERVPPETVLKRTFSLTKVSGQWRIARTDDGLLLSTTDRDVSYRQFNMYFLAPSKTTVVPDPVLLPAALPGLATKLVTRLLQGPTSALQGAVETAFPQGTKLEVASVPVRGGLATIDLNDAALQADPSTRNRMSAQIAYTLRQLPEVRRVRIRAAGNDLVTSGVPREQPVSTWGAYNPDILGQSASLYVVRDSRVGQLVNRRFEPLLGPVGLPGRGYRQPAVSPDAQRIAVTDANRGALFVGRLSQVTSLDRVPVPGTDLSLSPASWDENSDLWLVDRTSGRLLLYPRDGKGVVPVPVPRLEGGLVSAARVARDGTRIALVAGRGPTSRLYLGAVLHSPSGGVQEIDALREVLPDLRGISDVSWLDADTLVAVGVRRGDVARPLQTDTDGLEVDADIQPLKDLVSVAAAPAGTKRPLVAATAAGQLHQWDASLGWLPLGLGRDPAYPG
ncbi:MAG: hypothetical protein QOE40_2305 [Actinomycetota bacterium]|nr:hypothetical protein [Actinomycetota bacterium]